MKAILIPALMALAFVSGPARADEIDFRPAYHLTPWSEAVATDLGERAIRFDDFFEIDWEQFAQTHFKAYPLTGLSETQIAEIAEKAFSEYYAYIGYDAPVTEDYSHARFVFLSADGMRPLTVTGLRGSVRYKLGNDPKTIEGTFFSGDIRGVPDPNDTKGGGFVAFLKDGQELLSETVVGPGNPALDATNSSQGLAVARQIEYRFSGDDAAYLFVQYEADVQGVAENCQFTYLLFRKDPKSGALTELHYATYACDV